MRRDAPTLAPPARIEGGLARTRRALGERLDGLLGRGLDTAFWTGLEEALLEADVGVAASLGVVERVQAASPADQAAARGLLRRELAGGLRRARPLAERWPATRRWSWWWG